MFSHIMPHPVGVALSNDGRCLSVLCLTLSRE